MPPADFQRYLRAKRTVDDRSLDRRLLDALTTGLADLATDRDGPVRVLEVGAGVGTMIERLLAWDRLPQGPVEYTAVDVDPANTAALPDRLRDWTADRPVTATEQAGGIVLDGEDRRVSVTVGTADAADFVAGADREWDLLIGMAFLDIVGLDRLPLLLSALAPGGYWYFPITFDGGTRFGPDHPADDAVERQYHRHMDAKPGGDSRAGQHVLDRLHDRDGVTVTGVAGSDWAVYPQGDGYPADEGYFLRYVLGTIETALGERDHGEVLDDATLADWLDTRRQQVADAELVYLTHQLDLLGRAPSPPARD
ncbi:hypothetical protein [Halorientalis marina]|jgi:hypothetical protein|uniref:hypothetical protein n=1 Tax=Halorientalis marina TaxID=2931976 RepID=UPI001FF59B6B|nr:hypothetical protein [Halorientalis marina]